METLKRNRVEFMEEMQEDTSVVFRKFIKFYAINKNKLIVFLEGADDIKYYLRKFEEFFGNYDDNWSYFDCDKRSNVIQLVKDLSIHTFSEYRDSLHLGFIDKDYNEVGSNEFPEKIYITPSYSIENFYATDDFFKKLLKLEFNLRENDPNNNDFERCFLNFVARKNDFIESIMDLEYYLKCHFIMYERDNTGFQLSLRDLNLIKKYYIGVDRIKLKNDIPSLIGVDIELFDKEVLQEVKDYYSDKDQRELCLLIRGKFIFEFICAYLSKLIIENGNKDSILFQDSYTNSKRPKDDPLKVQMKKTKLKFKLDEHDLLSVLSKYVFYPECLDNFIRKSMILSKVA